MRLFYADIPEAVYDTHRQVIVLPQGLSLQDAAKAILALMRERR